MIDYFLLTQPIYLMKITLKSHEKSHKNQEREPDLREFDFGFWILDFGLGINCINPIPNKVLTLF